MKLNKWINTNKLRTGLTKIEEAEFTHILDRMPTEYIEFLKFSNGYTGEFGEMYVDFWPANEILSMNEAYCVSEFISDIILFGSDGGNEAFAYDFSTNCFIMVPFIGLKRSEIVFISENFMDFLGKIAKGELFV